MTTKQINKNLKFQCFSTLNVTLSVSQKSFVVKHDKPFADDCKFVLTDWRVLIKTKPGFQSTESLWSDSQSGVIKTLC